MGLQAFVTVTRQSEIVWAPSKVRQNRLGHADSEATFGYTRADGELPASDDQLNRFFDPNQASAASVEN